jgi:hypothetical protein
LQYPSSTFQEIGLAPKKFWCVLSLSETTHEIWTFNNTLQYPSSTFQEIGLAPKEFWCLMSLSETTHEQRSLVLPVSLVRILLLMNFGFNTHSSSQHFSADTCYHSLSVS